MNDVQTKVNADLSGAFALANDLVSTTVYPSAVIAPAAPGVSFSGKFEGLGHTITGLSINDVSGAGSDGLFGFSIGTIRDLYLDERVGLGANDVGGLIGVNAGTIFDAYFVGSVHGGNLVGGLVGANIIAATTARFRRAPRSQRSAAPRRWEGWSGRMTPPSRSPASSKAQSRDRPALADWSAPTLALPRSRNSFSVGAVSGTTVVGGLVGLNTASVNETSPQAPISGPIGAGGLVGGTVLKGSFVANSYWDTHTTGQTTSAGGGPV